MRVERLEKAIILPSASASVATLGVSEPFTNLDALGKPTAGDHVAVYQAESGLIWTAAPLLGGKDLTHAEALKAAADLDLLGKRDWRAPTIKELLSLIDYARYDPAVDPKHFKGPYGWTWSSTIAKAPAGCAWCVNLDVGFSSRFHQDDRFRALAVRAGQQLGLSV
jgi:hypothetical protein